MLAGAGLQVGSTWQFSGSGFFLGAEARIKNTGGSWTGVSTYAGGTCALPESAAGSGSARSGDYAGWAHRPGRSAEHVAGWRAGRDDQRYMPVARTCRQARSLAMPAGPAVSAAGPLCGEGVEVPGGCCANRRHEGA